MSYTYENKHVIARSSNIQGAGLGLFAKHDFPVGIPVVEYKGQIMSREQVSSMPSNKSVVSFNDGNCLYCDKDCLASFANDCVKFPTKPRALIPALKSRAPFYGMHARVSYNVELKLRENGVGPNRAFLYSRRAIKAGDEICTHYGFGCWFQHEFDDLGFTDAGDGVDPRTLPDMVVEFPAFKEYVRLFYTEHDPGALIKVYSSSVDTINKPACVRGAWGVWGGAPRSGSPPTKFDANYYVDIVYTDGSGVCGINVLRPGLYCAIKQSRGVRPIAIEMRNGVPHLAAT